MQQIQNSKVPIRIFYSYAHEDKRYQQRIKQQLGLLKNQGLITQFSDQDILPGQEWKNEVNKKLEDADIILLVFFTIIDTIVLSILFYNWLNLAFLISFILSSLLFLTGITNKNGIVAYFITSTFAFIWIFIGLNYIVRNYHLSLNQFWFLIILMSFLQLMLFRPHKNRRRRRYRRII